MIFLVSVDYDYRILCDAKFIQWLSRHPQRTKISSWLMHIKGSSLYHRRHHNIILSFEAKKLVDDGKITKQKLSKIFRISSEVSLLEPYKDDITKNIIFAISLTHKKPHKCYLFTDNQESVDTYEKNTHYNNIKQVIIREGDDAFRIVKAMFEDFCLEREKRRSYSN